MKFKKFKVITFVILIVIYGLIIFFGAPNLNPLYSDGLAFWCFVITSFLIVMWLVGGVGKIVNHREVRDIHGDAIRLPGMKKWLIALAILPWVILILVNVFTMPLFFPDQYRDQMTKPEAHNFTSDIQPLDISQLPVVDYNLAKKLADKKLGEKPALGSQVTLGDPTIQRVDGKLVWVVPLQHSGFFKWASNMAGSPGYIVISANNPANVQYVDKYPIKYQPNGYFMDNLNRKIRFSGAIFKGVTDYSFELDDSGKPYWVITTYKNRLGFSLPEADGVLIMDAATGATTSYALDKVPSWVDRVQPTDFVMTQLNNRGSYIHGVFNFSNKDKFQTSENYAIVYNKGRCYLFTGLTSVGSDESATGFMMVDLVSKKSLLYNMSGATEYAAQKSAEGKFQNYRYTASFPLITNVSGEPTYFMTLKDEEGLIKQYAFVSVKNYMVVGTGESIPDAVNDYARGLTESGSGSGAITTAQKQKLSGTIARIASEQQGGNTIYRFTLTDQPGKIFSAPFDISNELSLTMPGDVVDIEYNTTTQSLITITAFDNQNIK